MNFVSAIFTFWLKRRFDRRLSNIETFFTEVTEQHAAYSFPESDMVMCVFPALAYAALARKRGRTNPVDVERMAVLVRVAIRSAVRMVQPPDGDLVQLQDYGRQAVYLGLLNLALGSFQWATGDKRFEPLHNHLCRLLHAGFLQAQGGPLWSFPHVSWPFDSLSALLSLHLRDLTNGGFSYLPPRGGALALTLPWLWPLDPILIREFYHRFTRLFWQHTWFCAGFREWTKGQEGAADYDSGPVVAGFGVAATAFGLAANQVAGDRWRAALLGLEFLAGIAVVRICARWQSLFHPGKPFVVETIRLQPDYLTGFLFGDACLFMIVTLRSFSRALSQLEK